jgi:hypothetical protein
LPASDLGAKIKIGTTEDSEQVITRLSVPSKALRERSAMASLSVNRFGIFW